MCASREERRVERTLNGHIESTFGDISLCKLSLQQPCGTKEPCFTESIWEHHDCLKSLCLWLVYVSHEVGIKQAYLKNKRISLWIRQLNAFIHIAQ